MNNHTIGSLIQYYRKRNKLSQQDLAKQLNISRQAISRWELDQSLPDLEMMKKLAEIFNISINDLMGVENQNEPISEIYDQIQTVLKHIQSSNKQRNILQMMLILICVVSLSLTIMMKVQLDQQNEQLNKQSEYLHIDDPTNPSSHSDLLENHLHEFSSELFLMNELDLNHWPKEASYMNVTLFDLNENTVTLDYQFILKEYQEDTQMTLKMTSENYSLSFPLEKQNANTFIFNQNVPIDDYTVDVLIHHNDSTILERLDKECAFYMDYIVKRHILLSIATDDAGHLDLTKIQYANGLSHVFPDTEIIGQLEGNIYVTFQFGSKRKTETLTFLFEEPSIQTLNHPLPTDEQIFIYISYFANQGTFTADDLIGTISMDNGYSFFISEENVELGSYMICHGL